ncbi:unnamed protein product [Ectocarpus fasciculatus]
MPTSNRLSLADARAIVGLPAVRGSSTSTTDLPPLDQHRAPPAHWDGSVPLPVREFGGTLKSRFAALARKSGAGRKETRDHGRSLVGRRANLEGRFGDDGDPGRATPGTIVSPLQRFQKAGRKIVRQGLQHRLQATPDDRKLLGRLGSLEVADGDLENAVEHLRLAAKGSDDDVAWTALARAEVRAWEQDPATGHERLRWACDAYHRSIDLLEPGFVQVWELPARLLELGEVYESFGSFEGALHIYQRIASSMPLSSGFEDVLFRCAVVMRYMATLERAPRSSLLESALEHLDLIMQEQALRKGFFAESVGLLYADVCMALAEASAVAKGWAKASYQEVFDNRKARGDKNAMTFRDWDDWIASPETQLQFSKEWSQKGEPALAVLAFEKALDAFGRQNEISPSSTAEPSFSVLMDASEAFASFQRFVRQGEQDQAEELVRQALRLQPENEEAKGLLRELLGDENCLRKEMSLQVVLHLQSKWRTRVWQGEYLNSLKKCLQRSLEERLGRDRLDMEARDQLAYFFREKHRPVVLYEDRCARVIQRLGRAGLFRLRWFAAKKAAYRTQLTNALKLWQKSGYKAESRAIIRARAANRYTPQTHKIVSVVALMDSQEEAAPLLQRAARSMLARRMFRKALKSRARDIRRQRKAAAICLQCQLRRFFARRELDRRISYVAQRIRATTFIQRVYRARALQWSYAVKRAQLAHERKIAKAKLSSSIKLQATWRMKRGRYEALVRRRAVSDIQRSTRGFLGRRRAAERKHELVTRIQQRQYRRYRERMVILGALLAMRASRERKEERAREVERRFRALEEQRHGNAGGNEAIATPLDKRRAARAHERLLRRIKAKGNSVMRARRWALQKPGKPSASQPTPGTTPSRSLSPPSSRRASAAAPLLQSDISNEINSRQSTPDQDEEDIHRTSPTDAGVIHQSVAAVPSAEEACPIPVASATPTGQRTIPSGGTTPRLLEDATSSSSSHTASATTATPTSQRPSADAAIRPKTGARGWSPSRLKLQGSQMSPPPPSPALKAALNCARGVGGRLGTPLGSPFPAPGGDWAAGRAASAAAGAVARVSVKLSGRAFEPSAPGSRFFPPFGPSGVASDGALCAPVVLEMVQDAADDEEDGDDDVAGTVRGWHGLTLYRPPGIGQRSPVFQRALQLETIAFSPDVQTPPRSTPPESPCRGSASSRTYDAGSARPQPATAICHGQSTSCRALACGDQEREGLSTCGRPERGAGPRKRRTDFASKRRPRLCDASESIEHTRRDEREQEQQWSDVRGTHFAIPPELHRFEVVKSTPSPPQCATAKADGSMSVTPAPLHVASEASTLFDSGDMIMVAGLLAHPESSLKGLVLHRAKLDTPSGREALLKCLELNKLCRLALGGCVWFDDALRTGNPRQYEWHTGRWWEKVCDKIKMRAFRLREMVVEGLERGGDALGTAVGTMLDDYFAKRFGSLTSISLVRCGLSDEGATAVARGIWASSGLTHVDLSANAISDVGVEALAKALVGDYPTELNEEGKGVAGSHEEIFCRNRPPVIKTLDLGQNRITDPGGTTLGAALPRSVSLQSITLSHNFMMEEAAQALLSAAASSRRTLKEIHCEGNLFDEDVCGHIAQALKRRDERKSPPHTPKRSIPDAVSPAPASQRSTRNYWSDRSPSGAPGCPRGAERIFATVSIGGSARVPTRIPNDGPPPPRSRRAIGDNNATFPTVAICRTRKRGHEQAQEHEDEREAVSSSYLAAAIGCPRIPAAAVGAVGSEEDTGRLPLDAEQRHRHDHGDQSSYNPMGNQFRDGLQLGQTRFRRAAGKV